MADSFNFSRLTGSLHSLLEKLRFDLRDREEQVFLGLTVVIGVLVGATVVAFILLTENLSSRLFPATGGHWRSLLIPALGSLAMGYLLWRYFPDARGSGVPQTKAALYAREGKITIGTVFGKFFCTAATLASGIPLGREGPSVQVGAGIASMLGRRLGLSREKVQGLLPVGASAAIAAAFNTPLAAVLFALEEIVGDLHAPVFGSVVLAAATSWMTLRLLLGNEPLFHVPQYQLVHPSELAIYAVLGILGGLVSVAFTKLLLSLRGYLLRYPKTLWWQPVIGGLTVGLMGWQVPQVLGVGYGHVSEALNGNMALKLMALLVVLKLVSTAVSYASGSAGGIFGPSLFIGAMLGGAVGDVAHQLLPSYTATQGAYSLVGMGTTFAGIVRAPMTSVLMIFEITRDYSVIVPLMISNLISLYISMRLQPDPIYDELAKQDGIHLPVSASRRKSGERRVLAAMRSDIESLPGDMRISEALSRVRSSIGATLPVTGSGGLLGVVNLQMLENAASAGRTEEPLKNLLSGRNFPHVHPDQPLPLALERMGAAKVEAIPVVSRANVRLMLGLVTLEDALKVYGLRQRAVSLAGPVELGKGLPDDK
jgi:CIC family chloride channel protein